MDPASVCRAFHTPETAPEASFTLEASLSLTLFLFASVLLFIPLLMLNVQKNLSKKLEDSTRQLSQIAYVEYYQKKEGQLRQNTELVDLAASEMSLYLLKQQLSHPMLQELQLDSVNAPEDPMIRLEADFSIRMPFAVLGQSVLPQQVISSRRKWIGAEGYRWGDSLSGEEQIVYISTKSNEVYHTTLSCSYITHEIFQSTGAEIHQSYTSYPGVRFTPCASCRPTPSTPVVYYTSGGKNYHKDINCKTMQSYIQASTLAIAQSQGRTPCSRCGGGKE